MRLDFLKDLFFAPVDPDDLKPPRVLFGQSQVPSAHPFVVIQGPLFNTVLILPGAAQPLFRLNVEQ